ncbi:MAG: VOC family protein [Thermoproteota archaeon]|nr:VOC family protein [Thermoproteota archaeon]
MDDNMTSPAHDFNIHPATRIGYVSLNVSDMDRSLDFYGNVLGFKKVDRPSGDRALLSVDGDPSYLVELLQAKKAASYRASMPETRRAGLYHYAILLTERKYLADMLQNLSERRSEIRFDGLADHLVSESIYIRDPDNIGIEIYCDRPSSQWKWDGSRVRMETDRLDTEDLLRESTASGWKAMPAKTVIGHVHLHVRNLAKAMKFYHKILGLNFTATYPGAYFFAAGKYHHHIATNIWLGTSIQLASSEHVGLNHFGIELPNKEQHEKTAEQLRQYKIEAPQYGPSNGSAESVFLRDMDDIIIRLYAR